MKSFLERNITPPNMWEIFEDLVADLYTRIWEDSSVVRYGRIGQNQ